MQGRDWKRLWVGVIAVSGLVVVGCKGTPTCPSSFAGLDGIDEMPWSCECVPGRLVLSIPVGDLVYHSMSPLCRSAAHAGAIVEDIGGLVTIHRGPLCATYGVAKRHGVESMGLTEPTTTGASYWFAGYGDGACLSNEPPPVTIGDLRAIGDELHGLAAQAGAEADHAVAALGAVGERVAEDQPALGAALGAIAGSADEALHGMKSAGNAIRDDINDKLGQKLGGVADAAVGALVAGEQEAAPPGAVKFASDGDCPATFAAAGLPVVTCTCGESGGGYGPVYGAHPFTADSSICAAARVAGVLRKDGGLVTARAAPGCKWYRADTRNGVTSRSWGEYHASFTFPAKRDDVKCATVDFRDHCPPSFDLVGENSFSCYCTEATVGGTVYGSGPYTGDSAVCAAARHAGVLKREKGIVHVVAAPGCKRYLASESNGITTRSWGAYGSSFNFMQNPQRCP